MKNRIISLLLMLSLVFSFASCKKGGEEIPPKDRNLTVETETVEYTADDINEAAAEVSEIVAELTPLLGYPKLNDEKKKQVSDKFKTDIMPVMIKVPVYRDELFDMLACMRECMEMSESEHKSDEKLRFFSDLYIKFNSILETNRLGALIYELQLVWLDESLERAKERYDKYGYPFYLDDIQHYTVLSGEARALGADSFTDAFSVLMFMASASLGTVSSQDGIIKISAGDLFVIMEKQSEEYSSISLTEENWKTVVRMCEEFIPDNVANTIKGQLLVTLDNEDFFAEAADVIPYLLDFYVDVTADISDENIDIIEAGEAYAAELVICKEILRHVDSFETFLASFEQKMPNASAECINAVKTYDVDGYEAFCENYGATADELISGIRAFVLSPTEENYSELEKLTIGYAATVNSVVAYVYLYL